MSTQRKPKLTLILIDEVEELIRSDRPADTRQYATLDELNSAASGEPKGTEHGP